MVVAPLALSGTNYSTTSRHGSETLPSLWLSLVYNSLRRIRSPCALGPTWQPSNRSFEFLFRQRGRKVQGSALRFALKRLGSVRRSLENRGNNRPPVIVVFRCNTDLITPLSLSSSPFPLSWVRMRYRVCRCPYRSVLRTVTIVGCGSRDRFEETDSEIFARIEWSSWQHVGLSCARRAFVGFFSSPRKGTSGYSLPPSSQRRVIDRIDGKIDRRDRPWFHVRRAWTELRWQGEKAKRTEKFCEGEVEKDRKMIIPTVWYVSASWQTSCACYHRSSIFIERCDRWDSPHGSSNPVEN